MDKELKGKVLRLFLEFIRKYVPLKEAIVASLGGEGREAAIWQQAGIPGENAWLIERKKAQSRRLITQLPYRYTSSLVNFSRVFRSIAGSNRGVDAFHLDLCGTIETSVDMTRRIIPLVVKSRGRCLAITVADARRNLSVEQFSTIEKQMSRLLGFRYARMWNRLVVEQGEDRKLAVMREIGFFFHLMDMLKFYGRYAFPIKVMRFAYVSHSSGAPFPMRTYFFRISDSPRRITHKEFGRRLYQEWFKDSLHDLNHPARELARPTKERTVMSNGFRKLRAIADAAGGDVAREYSELLAAAQATSVHVQFLRELSALIKRFDPTGQTAATSASVSVKDRRSGSNKNGDTVAAQLELIHAKVNGKVTYDKVRIEIGQQFSTGRSNKAKAARVARSLFARTQKRHRPAFLKRLAEHDSALINEDLAVYYGKITGKEVTADQLRSEAGL